MSNKIALVAIFGMTILSGSAIAEPIVTDSTSNSTTKSDSTTRVISPPPTAVAPSITTINNDICAVGASGAAQTQILGIAFGATMRDMNCERIKLSKNLYDMGMKVAAVANLCQDDRVFQAMLDAGTPCPVEGKIGEQAREIWIKRGKIKEDKKPAPAPVVAQKPVAKVEEEAVTAPLKVEEPIGPAAILGK